MSADIKLAGGVRKALLKALASRWLPGEIIQRKKVFFAMPLGQWLRQRGPLAHRVQALRDSESFAAEIVNRSAMERLIDEHNRGAAYHVNILWSLIALNSWASVFLGSRLRGERLPGAATGRAVIN